MSIAAVDIVRALDLEPHPEGGYYRETHRSEELVMTARGPRAASSAILFLITVDSPSRFHRLYSDELWLYHGGSRLELATLLPDGRAERIIVASAALLVRDEELTPQAIVPRGAWQAARVLQGEGVDWTLVSCVVSPGFDFDDFELADAHEISVAYPEEAELITALT